MFASLLQIDCFYGTVQKKICMLGAAAVGKTSLVRRFVKGIFSDQYTTTIGVKIEKKTVTTDGTAVHLLLWDINGEDRFQRVSTSYLRGAAGYLLVADGTRPETLETAHVLHQRAREAVGDVPFWLLINKADLEDDPTANWAVSPATLSRHGLLDWPTLYTSAKEDTRVDTAFSSLAQAMIA